MSGPNEFPNPLMKELGSPTDPTNPLMKWRSPGTDPTSQFIKGEAPGTDPTSPLMKERVTGTDPLSQVALNPQPLPPGNFSSRDPGPISKPSGGGGHGVRNGIIAVLIIAVLLIGGTFMVESFRPGNQGVAPNQLALLQPGVILRQQQVQVSKTSGGGGAIARAQAGVAKCNTTPTDGLVEHLIGGGVILNGGSPVLNSYPKGDSWIAYFAPGDTKETETVVAVCLREAPSFFTPSHTIDDVTSSLVTVSDVEVLTIHGTAEAACPSGEHILGGGFSSTNSGDFSIDATYPVSAGGADSWRVDFSLPIDTQTASVQAYAICSATLPTHLEDTPLSWGGIDTLFNAKATASCASGALLSGGYAFSFKSKNVGLSSGLLANDNSPVNALSNTPVDGDFVQQWYALITQTIQNPYAKGAVWIVCWDPLINATPTATTGSQPTATGGAQPTNTPAGQPTATPKPRATATSTPKPRPTNTPVPSCQVLLNGSSAMDANNFYLNVEVAAGIGHDSSVAQVQFSPASGLLSALNGATFSDKGAVGSGGYNRFTCAQLESASYGASSVPATNGEVFFVKVSNGHLAKVLVTVTPGDPFPSFTWTTYKP